MAKKSKETLKSFFRTGLRPTQENFADLIDAMTHSEDDIFVSSDKNIGIGTNNPRQKLEVTGAIQVGSTEKDTDGTEGAIRFNAKDKTFEGFNGNNWSKFGGGGGDSFWKKTGNEPLSFNDEVAIPIDPNDPNGKVNLKLGDNSNGTKIEVFGRPGTPGDQPISIGIGSVDENKLVFHLNKPSGGSFLFLNDKPENVGSERLMLLTDTPRLQVGKTVTLPDLSIEAVTPSRRTQPAVGSISGAAATKTWAYLMADSSATDNTGIYWTKGKKFTLASETAIPANSQNAATTNVFLECRADGSVFIPNLVTPASDARLKTNVTPFSAGIDVIKKIDTIRFQYKKDLAAHNDDWHIGVSAQNLLEVMPELVVNTKQNLDDGSGETDMLAIKGNELVYLAFNAIKELTARVEHLEKLLAKAGINENKSL
jgi:hypothetical protein